MMGFLGIWGFGDLGICGFADSDIWEFGDLEIWLGSSPALRTGLIYAARHGGLGWKDLYDQLLTTNYSTPYSTPYSQFPTLYSLLPTYRAIDYSRGNR